VRPRARAAICAPRSIALQPPDVNRQQQRAGAALAHARRESCALDPSRAAASGATQLGRIYEKRLREREREIERRVRRTAHGARCRHTKRVERLRALERVLN
jgi:hypothetical protein